LVALAGARGALQGTADRRASIQKKIDEEIAQKRIKRKASADAGELVKATDRFGAQSS